MDLASTQAEPMRNHDGSAMLDDDGKIVYRSQYLATHPLRGDCKDRMTPDGTLLTYMTGDCVIRTMNTAFGHDGWTTEITRERQVVRPHDAGAYMCERTVKALLSSWSFTRFAKSFWVGKRGLWDTWPQ